MRARAQSTPKAPKRRRGDRDRNWKPTGAADEGDGLLMSTIEEQGTADPPRRVISVDTPKKPSRVGPGLKERGSRVAGGPTVGAGSRGDGELMLSLGEDVSRLVGRKRH